MSFVTALVERLDLSCIDRPSKPKHMGILWAFCSERENRFVKVSVEKKEMKE